MNILQRIEKMAALPVAERRKLSEKLIAELRKEREKGESEHGQSARPEA